MYRKALLFDPSCASKVFDIFSPAEVKLFGKKTVKNFNQKVWDLNCDAIVERGNYLKFSQSPELRRYLLDTEGHLLVEASRFDRIWGIGWYANEAEGRESEWGQNKYVSDNPKKFVLIVTSHCLQGWDTRCVELELRCWEKRRRMRSTVNSQLIWKQLVRPQ